MALDTNIPMQGQQIDTASPLMNLVQMTQQGRLANAQLATSGIDLQNKKNLLTMQTLSAGAAGGQASYDQAKQLLQKNGVDVSGWAPDYQTGQVQAKALQTALIPPAVMMNADIQKQRNDIQLSGLTGNLPQGSAGQSPAPQTQASQGGQTVPQILAQPVQPTGPAGNAPPPLSAQGAPQQQADAQQGLQQIQQHYQNASPEDQKTAQNIVNGATQLQSMQNDPQAVQKFLDDPNNMHDQHNIDMRKLWMSDNSPGKQSFWQENAKDVQTGQAIGITPANPNAPPPIPTFSPPKEDPNRTVAANNAAYTHALDAHNADIAAWKELPAVKQAQKEAEAAGAVAGAQPGKAATSQALTDRIQQGLKAMLELNDKAPDTGVLDAGTKAEISKRFGGLPIVGDNHAASNAYTLMNEINKQQVVVSLQDMLSAAPQGSRMSQALIGLIDKANAVDLNTSKESRKQQIEALIPELKNISISEENVNAKLNGGAQQQYNAIPTGAAPAPNGWKYVGPVQK